MSQTSEEVFFKFQRRTLMTVCIIIFLYTSGLSLLLNGALKEIPGIANKGSLAAILFLWCLYVLHRYHHAFKATTRWSNMKLAAKPYINSELYSRGMVIDNVFEGRSEHEAYWNMWDDDNLLYTIEYNHDGDYTTKDYLKFGTGKKIDKAELRGAKCRERRAIFAAWLKCTLHDRYVTDNIFPYIFAIFALLEISGIFRMSVALHFIGQAFNTNSESISVLKFFVFDKLPEWALYIYGQVSAVYDWLIAAACK